MARRNILLLSVAVCAGLAAAFPAAAHEVYVLSRDDFAHGLQVRNINPFSALSDAGNLKFAAVILVCIVAGLVGNFLFQLTNASKRIHIALERHAGLGELLARLSLAGAFFLGAWSNSIFGPELTLLSLPFGSVIRIVLFVLSLLLALGLFTRLGAAAGIAIYLIALTVHGIYLFNYLTYLGALAVLVAFGASAYALDKKSKKIGDSRAPILMRLFYGVALIYTAVTVKLLHPAITLAVVNENSLTRFHWLFPHDPLLVVLGAAIIEIMIGLFILLGFHMRLVLGVWLMYLTLSLAYFGQSEWPHLILYGISFYLLLHPQSYTLDRWLHRRIKSKSR